MLIVSKSIPNFNINEFFSLQDLELNLLTNDENNEFDFEDDGENSLGVSGIQQKTENNENIDCNLDSEGSNENNGVDVDDLSKLFLFILK